MSKPNSRTTVSRARANDDTREPGGHTASAQLPEHAPQAEPNRRAGSMPTIADVERAVAIAELRVQELRRLLRQMYRMAGATKRGTPRDYQGDNPRICNIITTSGRPCRARAGKDGMCAMHAAGAEIRAERDARMHRVQTKASRPPTTRKH